MAPVHYTPSFSLPALPGSNLSLNQIGSYFNKTNNLLERQATKNNFLQQYSKYKIIQLYTHASDSSMKREPVIYFADSALYLSELIAENKPGTRLIVLSACETANGQLYKEEGVFSFNRGFASLGIPSSINNLWSVDNKFTYRVTEIFYKYLSEGVPADIALQKVKLEFTRDSRENKLPYYWAAAILIGKTEVLAEKGGNALLYFAIIILFIATASFFVWRKKKRGRLPFQPYGTTEINPVAPAARF